MKGLFATEVLRKTARIFAGKNIPVHMEGFSPRVVYDVLKKEPKEIYLPHIPDNIPPLLLAAVNGMLDHECGHILESSSEDICNSKPQFWHYIHNCIDDPRVNSRMSDRYPGCENNIRNAYEYIFARADPTTGIKPYDKSQIDAIDLTDEELVKDMQVRYSAMWFAYRANCRFSTDQYEKMDLGRLFGPLEAKMDRDKIRALGNLDTTDKVSDLTDYFVDFFKSNLSGPKGGGKPKPGKLPSATGERLEDLKKMEDELSDAIKFEIEHLAKKGKANIHFTDRFETVKNSHEIIGKSPRTFSILEFETATKTVANYLTKDLRRVLESRNRRWYTGGFRTGRLNQKSLHSVKLGNERVFSRKSEVKDVKAAVSLLIDLSGSMKGEKARIAVESAYAFALVLEQLKVPYEIWGFTTLGLNSNMKKAFDAWAKDTDPALMSKVINTQCPEVLYCFKSFEQNFDVFSKTAMVKAGVSSVEMYSNEDSLHVKRALERVGKRPEDNKTLFIFSDGMPAFGGSGIRSQEMLKYLDKHSKDNYGVDIFAIGIQSDAVKHYYKNFKIVNKLEELPAALFGFLKTRI